MPPINVLTIVALSLMAVSTPALGASHLNSQESIYERYGECGEPPLPDCQIVIDDANEQRLRRIALQEALDSAVGNERSRARSNEVIVGVMPHGKTVVDTQWEFLSGSGFSVRYSTLRFRRVGSECDNGRVWTTDGVGKNRTRARGWTGDFSYDSTFIGRTELKVGDFGPCAVIVTFVFE